MTRGNASSSAENLGAQYLAVVLSSILFGITTLQVYIYHQNYPKDKIHNRIVVPVLWVLDAFHLSLVIHANYVYLVLQLPLDHVLWSMDAGILDTELITVIVTSLYAVRIWNFARRPRRYLACVLVVAQLLQTTASIVDLYTTYSCRDMSQLSRSFWTIQFSLASHAFVDCFLAGAMCYYLQKGRSGFSPTDSTVVKLMQYVIGSGMVTAAFAIATLVAITIRPYGLLWTVFYFLLSKLYINSFLAFLNARQHIRKRIEGPSLPTSMSFSDVRFAGGERYTQGSHSGSTGSQHSNDAKAGPSLVILHDAQSSEGLAADKTVGISTSLTA